MTPLRKQLFAARDAHRGATYPGDLAADVTGYARVGPGRGAAVLAGTGIAALAAAAAIAMFLVLHAPDAPKQLSVNVPHAATTLASQQIGEQANAIATTTQVAQDNTGTSSILSAPSISTFVPSAAAGSTGTMISMTSVSADVPSFPSLTALMDEAGSVSAEQLQREQQLENQGSTETTTTTTTTTTTSL